MRKALRIILLLFFIGLLFFSSWKLWGFYRGYKQSKDSYNALDAYVIIEETVVESAETPPPTEPPAETPEPESTPAPTPTPDVSAWPQVDFAGLSEINPDIVGWIYIEGTNINYPVVQTVDNDYYLSHLFDGSYNWLGCIFLDARNAPDLSDKNSIIYGHHTQDSTMFTALLKYKEQTFYDEYPHALLVTPDAYYRISFFSGYVSDTWGDAWDLDFREYEYISWLNDLRRKSSFEAASFPEKDDKIVTLSTCTYEFASAKFVLHGYISEKIEKN